MPTHSNSQAPAVLSRHLASRRMALWEGRLSRGRLMERLGLSGIRASQILREMRDETPDWFEWDAKSKSYRVTEAAYRQASAEWKSQTVDLGLAAYLAESNVSSPLSLGAGGVVVTPWDFALVSPRVFSRIRLAIDSGHRVGMEYRSMSAPEPHRRTVEPHSLILAGRRWHLRGFCIETSDFRDFVLGRMSKVVMLEQKAHATAKDDTCWNAVVKVRIQAHPRLTSGQQNVVCHEFFEGTVARVQSCRGALVPYLFQELRLAVDPSRDLPPEYQMAVENIEEVRPWLSLE